MTGLQPGDLGIDWSFATIDPVQVAQSGAKFAIRYSAGVASDPNHPSHSAVAGKLITKTQAQAILGAGLDLIANDEWYETRVQEGATAGAADAKAAANLWKSIGLNPGASIYASWDTFPAKSKWRAVASYSQAYAKVLKPYGYYIDGYAGTSFLRFAIKHLLWRYGWRPNAGSWSNDNLPYQPDTSTPAKRAALVKLARKATPAHIWQTGNYWFNNSADENMIIRVPVGSHLEQVVVPAPPKPPAHRTWEEIAKYRLIRIQRLRALLRKKK